jgi:hypothetical protein
MPGVNQLDVAQLLGDVGDAQFSGDPPLQSV